jgi:methylglutamate dehydrogenase subunit D
MSANPADIATSAFAGLPTTIGSGRGVIVSEREGLGIARVAARRGQAARVAQLLRSQFDLEPPNLPRRASRADVAIAGIGPQAWLITRDGAGNAFAQFLQGLLGDSASVSDQSDAYVILRLTGPRVRAALAKLIPIDIHPESFRTGHVAQTVCGYVNVTLWRLQETPQSAEVFEIWVGRSLAVSLHQAISHGAAQFGFVRESSPGPAGAGGLTP